MATLDVYSKQQSDTKFDAKANVADVYTKAQVDVKVDVKADLSTVISGLSTKQDTLVSGTNIKTINNTSLLGSGDITINPSQFNLVKCKRGTDDSHSTVQEVIRAVELTVGYNCSRFVVISSQVTPIIADGESRVWEIFGILPAYSSMINVLGIWSSVKNANLNSIIVGGQVGGVDSGTDAFTKNTILCYDTSTNQMKTAAVTFSASVYACALTSDISNN